MKLETERDIHDWVYSAKALAVVSAWSAVGLFDRLRGGPIPITELPLEARARTTTIPILAHVGLVALGGDRIGLTPMAERLLAAGGMPTAYNLEMLADLGRMADVLREGGPVRDASGRRKGTRGGTQTDNPEATEAFMNMLYRISEEAAQSTFTWLGPALAPRSAILDLGGGHGRYARVFADAGHAVTLFDQPMVTALARKRHGEALDYREGDFHEVTDFGGPYDLVFLANIVHSESDAQNASLVARAAACLKPGGRIAIRDMFLDELASHPPNAVFFGLTMLYYTAEGSSPTLGDARRWFQDAGLVDAGVITLETHQIVVAHKPA